MNEWMNIVKKEQIPFHVWFHKLSKHPNPNIFGCYYNNNNFKWNEYCCLWFFFLFFFFGCWVWVWVSEWCGFWTNSHDAIFSGCYPKHCFLVRSILLFSTRLLLVSGDHRWWALIDRGCVFLTQLLCGPRLPELGNFFFFFKRITGHS